MPEQTPVFHEDAQARPGGFVAFGEQGAEMFDGAVRDGNHGGCLLLNPATPEIQAVWLFGIAALPMKTTLYSLLAALIVGFHASLLFAVPVRLATF